MRPNKSFVGAARLATLLLISLVFYASVSTSRLDAAPQETASERAVPKTVLVVAPSVFHDALRPWIDYRESQGYRVAVISPQSVGVGDDSEIKTRPVATPAEIRDAIREFAQTNPLAAILIVGDGAPTANARYGWRDAVAAPLRRALVLPVFGGEEFIATDSYYSDLDGDFVPDVPIGRMPAETPEELNDVIQKIIRYETAPFGTWTRKINVYCGPNGLDLSVVGSSPDSRPAVENSSFAFAGISS
ncbi:MAG: hypothetical protein HUK22_06210, partial [Thermoguttaceae bacterium]|nr:hypothetical protein [Thermoguttaceae bacterium]